MSPRTTPVFQVDAFTSYPFGGNPAAVCLLPEPRDEAWMQKVAAEMNLSETAFLVSRDDGFDLRWFTPVREVPLCGHATLASAHTLWESGILAEDVEARFFSASGELRARLGDDGIEMDFPATSTEPAELSDAVRAAIPTEPVEVRTVSKDLGEVNYLLTFDSEQTVREIVPNLDPLRAPGSPGIIITARAAQYDFVSRYFVPWAGIDEDPVTGSAHTVLGPYWADKLGRTRLRAFQASARGGEVGVEVRGDRVLLTGYAVTTMRGDLLC